MSSNNRFDVAVIGRGLIGSAAGRHLAESGHTTALIGPGEPLDRAASDGPFASHHDEGRVTRIAGRTPMWAEVAALSIQRYADLEARSGIRFHHPVGFIAAYPDADDWIERAGVWGSDARRVDPAWVRETTGIAITNGLGLVHEGAPAGYIRPLPLVAAQTRLTTEAGGTVIEAAVTSIGRRAAGFEISGDFGSVLADRVLVATGAFGSELFEWQLALERRARTVVMARLDDDGSIPSLIADDPPDGRVNEIYWVPPVRYPDGSERIKIGGDMKQTILLDVEDLAPWFRGSGDPEEIECLTNNLRSLLPDAPLADFVSAPCVITGTTTGIPHIGWVDDHVAVAIGGKSSDELGRLASTLFSDDGWDSGLDREQFMPVFN